MRKQYSAPIIEKVVFDYRIQTQSGSTQCFGSVINVKVGTVECGEGTPGYIGWNNPSPADF